MKRKSTTFIIAIICLALSGAAAFIIWRSPVEQFLGLEVFKLTYEFLLIGVVGGGLSAIYKGIQHDRDQRAAERTLQRQLLDDCVKAYNAAKKARRLLRAKAIKRGPLDQVERDPYDVLMQDLMDAQLDFESFEDRVGTDKLLGLYPKATLLITKLQTMGNYLKKILEDYEKHGSKRSGQPATLELEKLGALKEFTDQFVPKGDFDTKFKTPFHETVKELQRLIIK